MIGSAELQVSSKYLLGFLPETMRFRQETNYQNTLT